MKVLQYNIYFGELPGITLEKRLENVCACILEQDADVVCLQEVLRDTYDFIVVLLKDMYPHVYPDQSEGLITSYETLILSRYPIIRSTKYKYEFTSMGRDMKLILIADDKSRYYICTTHFESEFKDGCMKKKYQYTRCADILYHLHKKTNIPIILCADTNVCSMTEKTFYDAFSYARGWRDSWIETGSTITNEITFDSDNNPILKSRHNDNKYRSRLDRILHISKLHAVNFKLFGTENTRLLSDHYGIMCEFTDIKPENRGDYVPHILSKHKSTSPLPSVSSSTSSSKLLSTLSPTSKSRLDKKLF